MGKKLNYEGRICDVVLDKIGLGVLKLVSDDSSLAKTLNLSMIANTHLSQTFITNISGVVFDEVQMEISLYTRITITINN